MQEGGSIVSHDLQGLSLNEGEEWQQPREVNGGVVDKRLVRSEVYRLDERAMEQ